MPCSTSRRPGSSFPPLWRRDDAPRLIDSGVARFRDPAHAHDPLPPFPAYVQPLPAGHPLPHDFPLRPRFAVQRRRSLVHLPITPGTSLYGGEIAGPLLRNGHRAVAWTTDAFDYSDQTPSLYQAHPWVLAVRPDGTSFGVIVETTYRCEIDLRRGILFRTDGPSPAVLVIDRPSAPQVLTALRELTGPAPMPPRWALGYHQCRWSYEPESRVREIAAHFRAHRIPCDALWLDIDYMRGFRCFTFDPVKFPDPPRLNADLRAAGFKTVWMIDPGIKAEPGYHVYDSARAASPSHFIQTADGHEYQGEVWPGLCAFPDFTRHATRTWWAGLYRDFLAAGIDGVWNDMNEPAVFDQPGKAMPADCRHEADDDLGGPGPHARYRNIYGMQMVRATREAIQTLRPDRRPFVLTRSNFLGGHRFAATWTGDNRSNEKHLAWSIPMVLNLGLSGQPFSGPDIGGFAGDATPELFARWMGVGSLLPFARGHSVKDSIPHEPWAFDEACEQTCRAALERRYALLPYFYTLFYEAHTTGLPVARPLFFADPRDARLRAVDEAFLLGGSLLVQCSLEPRTAGPPDPPVLTGWRPFEIPSLSPHRADWLPRLFLRPGSIIPLGPIMQFSDEAPVDPLTLLVAPDADGHAQGLLYEDAGDGLGFERGDFRLVLFRAEVRDGAVTLHAESSEGSFPAPARQTRTVLIQ